MKTFADVKTKTGAVYASFREVCQKLGIITNDAKPKSAPHEGLQSSFH